MLKKNLKIILITSLVIIIPMLVGLLLWNKLPDRLPTHWGFSGEVDGWSAKTFAVFGIPGIMLGLHLLCTIGTSLDPKHSNFSDKIMGIVFWICPVLSVVCMSSTYAEGLGFDVNVEFVVPFVMGVLFLVIGNYLPKCKQNYTVGIKLPWTLNDEENWNVTHRLAGEIWTVCSVVVIIGSFFKAVRVYTTFAPIAVMVFVPVVYSFLHYRKNR